jgi:hypothetical protein
MNLVTDHSYIIKAPVGDLYACFCSVEIDFFTQELTLIFKGEADKIYKVPVIGSKPKYEIIETQQQNSSHFQLVRGQNYTIQHARGSMVLRYQSTQLNRVHANPQVVELVFVNDATAYDIQEHYIPADSINIRGEVITTFCDLITE